jgi:hypothetical protein
MDYDEFQQPSSLKHDEIKDSEEIEFLVIELAEMAGMAGRYSRSVQLGKARYILRKLKEMEALKTSNPKPL